MFHVKRRRRKLPILCFSRLRESELISLLLLSKL